MMKNKNPFWSAFLAAFPYLPVALNIVTYRFLNLDYAITERIQLFALSAFLALVLVGWMRGFPAWSFPYLAVVAALFLVISIGNDSDGTFWENLLWKLMILGPPVLFFSLFWLFTRRRFPLRRLSEALRQDWTLLAFLVYSLLVITVQGFFSGIRSTYGAPFLLLTVLVAMTGSALFVLLHRPSARIAALAICFTLSWLVMGYASASFWHGRQESWMSSPADGWVYARGYAIAWAVMLFLMFAYPIIRWLRTLLPLRTRPVS